MHPFYDATLLDFHLRQVRKRCNQALNPLLALLQQGRISTVHRDEVQDEVRRVVVLGTGMPQSAEVRQGVRGRSVENWSPSV